jgi:hypothetical protein
LKNLFIRSQIAFGPVQFRLAEALTVLAVLTPAAIPGLFLGCLVANLVNPVSLGPVDIIGGSMATLAAAWLTWQLQQRLRYRPAPPGQPEALRGRTAGQSKNWLRRILVLSPSVVINALVVGFYLPYLIPGMTVSAAVIGLTMLSILISQSIVVYFIGLPLLLALEKVHPSIWRNRS